MFFCLFAFVAFTWVYVAFHFASSAFRAAFYWVHAAFAALAFRILCITGSAPAGGFWRLSGFGFSHPLLSQLVFASCVLNIASSSLVPPATPLLIKMRP